MAKQSKSEALAAWRKAEDHYRAVVDEHLAEGSKSIGKDDAVRITAARAKADKKLDSALRRLLD